MNRRQRTTELSHIDIKENLKPACSHARKLRLALNTLVTFAPFRDRRDVPRPTSSRTNFAASNNISLDGASAAVSVSRP
jgi:hypothetical protein